MWKDEDKREDSIFRGESDAHEDMPVGKAVTLSLGFIAATALMTWAAVHFSSADPVQGPAPEPQKLELSR